ncbi:serine/threonine-protein kinase [Mariniblastus fucicola]|nr:serine/threonine-protein kinase [Mariniblastus fucicola]
MDHHDSKPEPFDTDAAWDFLSDLIDKFVTQWESAPPEPNFADFADRIQDIRNAEFRRIGLIELVKVDFEFRSGDAFPWRDLAFYVQQWPELGSESEPPGELVAEQRRLRPTQSETGQGVRKASLLTDLEPDSTHTLAVHRSLDAHKFCPGDSVDDFDLLAQLGRGAFATVFLARQVSMQRLVALKISADEGHEGPTLAKLNHSHVVRVFDQRTLPEKSLRLMYMEYVAGGSLADVIAQSKLQSREPDSELFIEVLDEKLAEAGNSAPIESTNRDWLAKADWPKVVAKIGTQLAAAIEYTHGEGVLHRDIKPANILLDEHGHPKLVDFNISFGNEVIGATAASSFGGSLSYMSPEQLEAFNPTHQRTAEEIDGSCDVYALGVTLHELLSGQRPFEDVSNCEPIVMIERMLEQRKQGLSDQQISELLEADHLLGLAIKSSLSADRNSRPKIASLKKQLRWTADDQVSRFLQPPEFSWTDWRAAVCKYPWPFILAIVFGVSLFATLYVIEYNAAESVSTEDQALFLNTRQMINRTVYPIGLVLLIGLFWRTQKFLRQEEQRVDSDMTEGNQLDAAVKANLNFGHTAALLFFALWTVCGMLFPILLSIQGADLKTSSWIDFPLSHFLAGLICGAFVFFGLTMLSVVAWHPRLMMAALNSGTQIEFKNCLSQIRTRTYWYRVIAIGAPLVAIATLVNFRTSNTFAVSCLSIAAIVGLVAMANALRQIGRSLDLLERC